MRRIKVIIQAGGWEGGGEEDRENYLCNSWGTRENRVSFDDDCPPSSRPVKLITWSWSQRNVARKTNTSVLNKIPRLDLDPPTTVVPALLKEKKKRKRLFLISVGCWSRVIWIFYLKKCSSLIADIYRNEHFKCWKSALINISAAFKDTRKYHQRGRNLFWPLCTIVKSQNSKKGNFYRQRYEEEKKENSKNSPISDGNFFQVPGGGLKFFFLKSDIFSKVFAFQSSRRGRKVSLFKSILRLKKLSPIIVIITTLIINNIWK